MRMTLAIFAFVLFYRSIFAYADSKQWLTSANDIEAYIKENPSCKLEDILSQLSPELRSRFSLVYASRSPIEASLEKPRILLFSKDGNTVVSVGGDERMRGGQTIEIIERNPDTLRLKPTQINFSATGVQFNAHPQTCIQCHASGESNLGLRFVWDTYPNWPGVFGSAHYGEAQKTSGGILGIKYIKGTSGIPIPDFEKQQFLKLQASAATDPRYKYLIGLDKTNINNLAEFNTEITDLIGKANWQRIIPILKDGNFSLQQYALLNRVVYGNLNLPSAGVQSTILSGINGYTADKITRIKALIGKLGTPKDKEAFNKKIYFAIMDGDTSLSFRKKGILYIKNSEAPRSVYNSNLIYVLQKEFNINAEDLSFARKTSSYAFETGRNATSARYALEPILAERYLAAYKKALAEAKTASDFLNAVHTGIQLKMDQNSFALITEQSAKTIFENSTNGIEEMNKVLNSPEINSSLRMIFAQRALKTSNFSVDQANLLLNSKLIDPEDKKAIRKLVLAKLSNADVKRLKVPLGLSCSIFFEKLRGH